MKTKSLLTLTGILFATTIGFFATSASSVANAQTAGATQDSPEAKVNLTTADQLQIKVQEICPVTGESLGSMGQPIKVKVGQQTAFLCCKGCQGKDIDADHWSKIQKNIAEAQGTCPIMGKPVDASMKSTIVDGQKIFVCCPPCIEKINADPKPNLEKVQSQYKKHVAKEMQAASDLAHIKAQEICPVTGKPLGSMGDPIKVKVGPEEVAFLCCKGCVGQKIQAQHWQTVQTNLAKAQKTCPIMGKPVDATMKSVVVKGRKIFVCCPPCIDKIKADPDTFIKKVNQQITEVETSGE